MLYNKEKESHQRVVALGSSKLVILRLGPSV